MSDPSPVREVARFVQDEMMAKRLQQLYDDEREAHEEADRYKVEDEFEAVTRAENERRSEKLVQRLSGGSAPPPRTSK